MKTHPRPDEHGKAVIIRHPHTPTPLSNWADPAATAIVTPDGEMPAVLGHLPLAHWQAPISPQDWSTLARQNPIAEPAFEPLPGFKRAAGVVAVEPDGRVWVVAPTNAFGGYPATFPKGSVEPGMSLQATALREAWEEAGLAVQLTGFLVDIKRSTSFTRYYLARRIGGNPADMGWESQAVMLAPVAQLPKLLTNQNDQPILEALAALQN